MPVASTRKRAITAVCVVSMSVEVCARWPCTCMRTRASVAASYVRARTAPWRGTTNGGCWGGVRATALHALCMVGARSGLSAARHHDGRFRGCHATQRGPEQRQGRGTDLTPISAPVAPNPPISSASPISGHLACMLDCGVRKVSRDCAVFILIPSMGQTELRLPDELDAAIRRGEMKKMVKWLKKGDVVDAQDKDGNTLLHNAVAHGQPDFIRELVKRGATMEVPNIDGGTALMAAAQLGAHTEISLLLESSADANWQNHYGATALHTAAAHNKPGALSLLIDASAMVDLQTEPGYTALMLAAGAGADQCVRILLDAGASTELQNNLEQTALRIAEIKGRASTQLLLQRGCAPVISSEESAAERPLAPDEVMLKTPDGRRLRVPESSLHRPACTESRRSRRSLHRATGLLARDMRD